MQIAIDLLRDRLFVIWLFYQFFDKIGIHQGVAQLVARSVRDAEVVSSSLITLTIFYLILILNNCAKIEIVIRTILRKNERK